MLEPYPHDAPTARPAAGVLLALDQGTTNTKALLVDIATGAVLASAVSPVAISFPAPGWVEQDAAQLWDATRTAAGGCLEAVPGTQVAAVSISSQRESVVCWDRRTGEPLGPVLGWQDARTAAWCAELAASDPSAAGLVRTRTGLSLDPMFSAPKMRAAIGSATAAGARVGDVAVGTVDSWLLWCLTGEHLTEMGNAARTLLLDLESCAWDADLLDLFAIPETALAQVRASDAGFGRTLRGGPLPAGVPVVAVLADSHAAMYQHGCTEQGTGKATYGTGSSVMTPTAALKEAPAGIATTLAWHVGGSATYAREGNILASGSALDWMATTLAAPAGASGGAYLTDLARSVPDSGGVTFVPAFSGLGAPYWDRNADGVILGVTAGTTRAHLARAAIEAVAHQVADVVEAIESDGQARIDVLRADGGATRSALLMQTQANLLRRPVHTADAPEASALGAATLARRTLGHQVHREEMQTRIIPEPGDQGPGRRAWARAVARSRGQATTD
ncbi:FGGY-family carbohydrate kinase [Cellulomonas hominis]